MVTTGIAGFIFGMITGAVLNRYLLRNVPVLQWRTNRDIRLRYGALNWAFGIAGIFAALYLEKLASVW